MDEIHSEDLLVELEAHFWVLDTDHGVIKLVVYCDRMGEMDV